jgi:hypothetical protein
VDGRGLRLRVPSFVAVAALLFLTILQGFHVPPAGSAAAPDAWVLAGICHAPAPDAPAPDRQLPAQGGADLCQICLGLCGGMAITAPAAPTLPAPVAIAFVAYRAPPAAAPRPAARPPGQPRAPPQIV